MFVTGSVFSLFTLIMRSDLLYDREGLLQFLNLFFEPPGDSGCVVSFWLKYIVRHVHEIDTCALTQMRLYTLIILHWEKRTEVLIFCIPTSCEELPCSRNYHCSALGVLRELIKAGHHLTGRETHEFRSVFTQIIISLLIPVISLTFWALLCLII